MIMGEDQVSCIYGDGAYDKRLCYETAYRLGAQLIAPVQHGVRKQQANRNIPNHPALKDRDRKLEFIEAFADEEQARKLWKQVSGYHKRSLVENAFFRLKHYFGHQLQSRKPEHQAIQVRLRAYALNQMTALGMPQSQPI